MADDKQPSFGAVIDQIVAEKGISREKVLETIEAALAAAYRKDNGEKGQDIRAEFSEVDGSARIFKVVTVVEDELLENPAAQTSLTDAKKDDAEAVVGKEYVEEVTPTDPHYGRVAAQTAKQVIIQRIREAEREAVFDEYKDKEGEIISGIVQRIEGDAVFVDIGRVTGILFPSEQVKGERYRVNQRIRVYVVKVELSSRGPEIILSRSHPGMLRRLFELEVPEIFAGSVEIKNIAREAAERSKVAVWVDEDQLSLAIGKRGQNVRLAAKLSGWRIDIVKAGQEAQVEGGASPFEETQGKPDETPAVPPVAATPEVKEEAAPASEAPSEEKPSEEPKA
ncbi:MAG: transcription termination/antitermination protein NusA [Candidatus Andersenbacteria bacterium]|nr:transcription termination/antitermination protein NusA [Candidatus Andersenbacteria bacterium]